MLTKHTNRIYAIPLCLACFLSLSLECFGSLGGDASTIQQDQARTNAALRVTQTNGYAVHELQSAKGIRVREYVSPQGRVFAVAWHGPWMPNLELLLGDYYGQYQQALAAEARRHGPVLVRTPGLVVQLGGHMRDFVGRAYLPDEIPAGVRLEDIH